MLANNIRYLRRKKEMSQEFIAEKLGYKSYTTVQKWETGVSEPSLGQRIKELRLSENMTQEEFGKKFNVVKSTISLYENNKISPDDELKKSMAKYFGVTLDYLMGVSDIKNPYQDKSTLEETEEDPLAGYEIAAHKEGDEDFTLEQKIAIANLIEETLKKIEKGKKDKDI